MEEALDCIQKLIAYGYLRGTARGPASRDDDDDEATPKETRTPSTMDSIIETICGCDDFDDDNVQLQVIKALLTAVTSQTWRGARGRFVGCRAVVLQHPPSDEERRQQNDRKATLTQMLSIVFQRMEAADAGAPTVPDTTYQEGDSVHVPDYGLGTVVSCDGTNCVVALQAWEQDARARRGPEQ